MVNFHNMHKNFYCVTLRVGYKSHRVNLYFLPLSDEFKQSKINNSVIERMLCMYSNLQPPSCHIAGHDYKV